MEMKILIIEDEHFAAKRLRSLIADKISGAIILDEIDTVEDSVLWFENNSCPDLVFMDIQLADGLSFQIFEKTKVECPVVFTTAYDEYALDAFKVNSIDYLLKPIELEAFTRAINKYEQYFQNNLNGIDWKNITHEIFSSKTKHKQRFLIKTGQSYSYLNVADIDLIFSEDGMTFALKKDHKKVIIDKTLDQLVGLIDPKDFYRINRKYIVPISSINKIHPYFNSRLKLEMNYNYGDELIVSREKASAFKDWLDS